MRRKWSRPAADVLPMRAMAFERDRGIANTLAAEADTDGIVVYGSPKGSCMKAPDPEARWRVAERWLQVAGRDRGMVLAAMVQDPPCATAPPSTAGKRSKSC